MNATLDTDFSEGDIFTAGAITSTSSLNGITTTVNSNSITKLIYVDSLLTTSSVVNSTLEMVLADFTIPGGTIDTGAIIQVELFGRASAAGNNSVFKIKTGVDTSEVIRYTKTLNLAASNRDHASILYYDENPTWANDVSVLVTGQNSETDSDGQCFVFNVVITGY